MSKELSTIKLEKIKEYLQHSQLFHSLVVNYLENPDDENLIHLLKTNYRSNQSLLGELGVEFKEKDTIRELNTHIRELEAKVGQTELDFDLVCNFLQSKRKGLESHIRKYGLHGRIYMSIQHNLEVSFNLYTNSKKGFSKLTDFKTQEAYDNYVKELDERHNNFLNNFETCQRDEGEYCLSNTDSNIKQLQSIFKEYFNEDLTNFKYNVAYHFEKDNKNEKEMKFNISEISFSVLYLASSKSLHRAFSEY